MLHYMTTGDHGFRFVKRSSSNAMKAASILLCISIMLTFSMAISDFLHDLALWFEFENTIRVLAFLLGLFAIILISVSQYQMRKSWRVGVDESEKLELITHGVYAHIRNPIYTGLMLFALALFILVPNMWMLLGAVIGYCAIEIQVRYVEEPYLMKLHAQQFDAYLNHTNRYFPWY